ncbi:MAG: PAS domain S-box protein, partial [Chloroflexi bacterium]|nr:PAS domain S-box protein [Chloroflexota bacterium]
VSAALAPYAGSLHAALARRFAALDALRVSVQADRLDVALELRFEAFANGLAAGAEGIRSFTVAPGGVVQYVSPLAGNERALGRDLLNGPQSAVSDAARRAVQTRRITLSPPDGLREGAALAAWQAVYLGDRFWGIVALELEAAPVLAEAGLAPGPAVLRLALRDGQGRMLHGDARLFDSDAMIARVELPEGAWELAATPARGWNTALQENLLAVQGAGLLAAAALAGLVYLISNRQAALERAVQQRTSELRRTTAALETDIAERQRAEARLGEREEQYRRIFEETTDGLILNDENGAIVEANPAAYRMHGYSYQEFILLSPTAIIHPESFPLFRRFQETVAAGAGFRTEALDVRKDGSVFPVEVRGSLMMYRGRPHHLAMLRDITEQVEATQILERRVEERTRELSTLREVSHTLASTLEVGPLVRSALRQLKELVDYTGAAVMAVQGDRLIALEYRGPMNARQLAHVGAWWDTLPDHRRLLNMTETVSIGDVLDGDPRNTTFMEAADEGVLEAMGYVRSLLTVPLLIQERPVGVLRLDHREAHHFTPEHVALATAFANQMAVAFENARLYQEEHERRAEAERRREAAEGLSDILAIVNSNRPLDDILEAIMAHAAALLG